MLLGGGGGQRPIQLRLLLLQRVLQLRFAQLLLRQLHKRRPNHVRGRRPSGSWHGTSVHGGRRGVVAHLNAKLRLLVLNFIDPGLPLST